MSRNCMEVEALEAKTFMSGIETYDVRYILPILQKLCVVTAIIERDGQILDGSQPELLGEAYGMAYDEVRAEEMVEMLEEEKDDEDIHYSIRRLFS